MTRHLANLQMEPTRSTVCAMMSPRARGSFGPLDLGIRVGLDSETYWSNLSL